MKISISKDGIIEYYGNQVGYVKDNKAVVDVMFQREEIAEFLTQKNGIPVEWKSDVYDNLLKGNIEETSLSKNCRIYQLKPETDLRMRFVGYNDLKEKGFDEPNVENYRVVFDGNVGTEVPEEIYDIFDGPDEVEGLDATGVFISDVIELYDDESSEFYYINPSGFVKLNSFTEPKNELKQTETVKEEKVITEEPKEEHEAEFVAFRERLDMGYGRTKTPEREAELNTPKTSEEIQVDTFKIDM